MLIKLDWKVTEIIQTLQKIYVDHAPKKTCTYKWIERFQDGRKAVEDDEGCERPTTLKIFENGDAVKNLVEKDSC